MKSIELDDSVYAALEKRVMRFGETPNDVIKRLLAGDVTDGRTGRLRSVPPKNPSPLMMLIQSPEFGRKDGREKYFAILSELYRMNPEGFLTLDGFTRGSRIHISRDVHKIEASGSSTMPKQLPSAPYFVLTNLDNRRKREIIADVMRQLGHPEELIAPVARSIPDSRITRTRRIDLSILDLPSDLAPKGSQA